MDRTVKFWTEKCYDILNTYKDKSYDKFNKIWNDKLQPQGKDLTSIMDPIDIMKLLMFGESQEVNENITKKIDFQKNKSLFKTIIKSAGLKNTVAFMSAMASNINDMLIDVSDNFAHISKEADFGKFQEPTFNEIERYTDILEGITWEATHILSKANTLRHLVANIDEKYLVTGFFKRDTLKRYYFDHVYELKNNVSMFDKEHCIFGEINFVMYLFDVVFDFLFGEFNAIFNSLLTNFETFMRK